MMPRKKQHHTLSDLLADDVRDYFLREGVPEPPQRRSMERSRSESGGRRRAPRSSATGLGGGGGGRLDHPSSPDRKNRENRQNNNESPQRAWKSLPPSEMANFSPLRMEHFDQDVSQELDDEQHNMSPEQQTQQRGQNTAERPNFDRSDNNNRQQMMHRRHESGSGSFNSRVSNASSHRKKVNAADAEFLRRYAEERERTNMRMQAIRVNLPSSSGNNLSPPRHPGIGLPSPRQYHGRSLSPRPPTVTGSHRPGLPSIDNDDWEEDDRIERRDIQKKSRREARKLDRHRRKQSSIDGSIGGASFVRQNTGGSLNDTMEYSLSTSSAASNNLLSGISGPIQEMYSTSTETDQNNNQSRHVRPLSYLSASSDSGGEAGETSQEELRQNSEQDDPYFSRISPPPNSYYSGARGHESYFSDTTGHDSYYFRPPSGNDSYYSRQTTLATPDFMLSPSPSANYSVGQKFIGGSDASTMHSSLRGSSIYSDASSRERSYETRYADNTGGNYFLRSPQEEDENDYSEGSSDSYESDESSYTSDDYYESESYSESNGSSSYGDSHNQWERVANARHNYRDTDRGRHEYRDSDRGRYHQNERQTLLNKSSKSSNNYSSVERQHSKTRKKHRDPKFRRSHRPKKVRGPPLRLDDALGIVWKKMYSLIVMLELLISNMPSLIGSLALAWASLGVDWFKWYEENASDCIPTDYHDPECVYPEFPGCFVCDTSRTGYRVMLNFHYFCSTISFVFASCLIGKLFIAFPVVRDELANPTTAAPLGLLCMALDKCFAGNFGFVGAAITFISAALQTTVLAWFIFISVVYKTLPEPSWFPNTTGIGLAAAKMFLYWTLGGYFLSGVSLVAFFMFYFVALYRLHTNEKISAVVCWLQLSGPAVVLYGYSIFAQPGSDADFLALSIPENKEHYYEVHRKYFMPLSHLLFAFCMISMASALYCLKTRWAAFRSKEFSPAHVGFCAPLASHANAIQAYRASLNRYSLSPPNTLFKEFLYRYWALSLICGTVLTVILTCKFLRRLPQWCQLDVEDDEIPPPPDETIVTKLLQNGEAADAMNQHFVSAAVLQANESGALVRVLRDGKMKYVRSRRMPSMGFDPILNVSELMSERDRLIQHISYAANPSRDRGGLASFDDTLRDFQEPDRKRASSRRNKLNFMSFDASTMMRGDF